jgi:hypothetical protein
MMGYRVDAPLVTSCSAGGHSTLAAQVARRWPGRGNMFPRRSKSVGSARGGKGFGLRPQSLCNGGAALDTTCRCPSCSARQLHGISRVIPLSFGHHGPRQMQQLPCGRNSVAVIQGGTEL